MARFRVLAQAFMVIPFRAVSIAAFGFRRHVIFIVLGQHFARAKNAVGAQRTLCDHALAFLEQVGKKASVGHRNGLRGVSHAKAHRQAVGLARQTSGLDHAADAKRSALRRLVGRDLRRCEKEHQVRLERVEHQRGGDAEPASPAPIQAKRRVRGFIELGPVRCRRRARTPCEAGAHRDDFDHDCDCSERA